MVVILLIYAVVDWLIFPVRMDPMEHFIQDHYCFNWPVRGSVGSSSAEYR